METRRTLTNGDVRALIALIDDIEAHPEIRLPVRGMYALSKNRGKLVSTERPCEKTRLKLVKKHGETDVKGVTRVKQENMDAFKKDWLEVMSEEVDVEFHTYPLSEIEESVPKLGGITNCHLLFDYLIEDDTDKSRDNGQPDKPLEAVKGEKKEGGK